MKDFFKRLWEAIRNTAAPFLSFSRQLINPYIGVIRASIVTFLAGRVAAIFTMEPGTAVTVADLLIQAGIGFTGMVWINMERVNKPTPIVTDMAAVKAEEMIEKGKLESNAIVTKPQEKSDAEPKFV